MSQHQAIRFSIQLTYDKFLKVYQGHAKNIVVQADDGRKISFPARNIQSFLTKEGIFGYFEMQITFDNKFIAIKRIDNKSTS